MADLFWTLFSVTGFVVALAIGVVWLLAAPRTSSGPRRWLVVVLVFYALASTDAFVRLVARPLVAGLHQFDRGDAPPGTRAVVVLGGGSFTVHGREQRLGALYGTSASRVLEGARVYRLLDTPTVISSGGARPSRDLFPESIVMRDALVVLGVPASHVVLESESRNTHDEATLIAPMLRQMHAETFVLVTSEQHMRRSLGTFRRVGLNPIPAIALDPFESSEPTWRSYVPTPQGLDFGGEVAHDYIGLVYYSLRGWM